MATLSASVVAQPINEKLALLLVEENSRLWAIWKKPKGGDSDNKSGEALNYEDPAPALETTHPIHFLKTVREEARKCSGQ